jgi:cytochrome P450
MFIRGIAANWYYALGGYYIDRGKDALTASGRYLYGSAASTCRYIKAVTIGDAYEIVTRGPSFIFGDLYQRSRETGFAIAHFGPTWQSWHKLPKFVVVSGKESNIANVANYGEEDPKNIDPATRTVLAEKTYKVTERDTVLGMLGEKAQLQRKSLKLHLSEDAALEEAYHFSREFAQKCLKEWNPVYSFQENIAYFNANVIARCVVGVPGVDMDVVPILLELDDFVVRDDLDSQAFYIVRNKFREICQQLESEHAETIYNRKKIIYDLLELDNIREFKDLDDLKEKVKSTHGARTLFTTGNMSMVLSGAIAYISQNEDVRKRLRAELADNPDWQTSYKKLNQLHYLNCVYLEALRIMSPTHALVRRTSRPAKMTVEGKDNIKRTFSVPAGAYLFAPIRCINNDPDYWQNPQSFVPARFENNKKYHGLIGNDHLNPFGAGNRSCPAGSKFVPVVMKCMLAELFSQHDLRLDKPIEPIPADSAYPRFKNRYTAVITPYVPEQHDEPVRANQP